LLKDAAGWYCTCLNKEDIVTYGKNGGWLLMHPYNKDKAPNLDVLHIQATDQYLMSYSNGTFCVDGLDSLYVSLREVVKTASVKQLNLRFTKIENRCMILYHHQIPNELHRKCFP
jgi:hypothetical protein